MLLSGLKMWRKLVEHSVRQTSRHQARRGRRRRNPQHAWAAEVLEDRTLLAADLYAITGSSGGASTLYVLDSTTGAIDHVVGATGFNHIVAMDVDPVTGQIFAYSNASDQLLILDPDTGAATVVGSWGGAQIPDMSFRSDGTLFAWVESGAGGSDDLATIDTTTGAVTIIPSPIGTSRTGVAFDSADNLYVKTSSTLYHVDPADGSVISSVSLSMSEVNLLEFSPDDILYTGRRFGPYTSQDIIDVATGQVTNQSNTFGALFGAYAFFDLGLRVSATDPANNSVVFETPTEYDVDVSEPIVPGTLDAADFEVNGIPADSVADTPGTTSITFTFSSDPVTAQGVQTMHVAADAFNSVSDGTGVKEFSGSFRYDAVLMQVTSTDPADGSVIQLPATTLDLNFNEAYDFSSAQPSDFALNQGSVSAVSQVDADTLRLTLDGVTQEGSGTLTVNMAAGAMTDVYGNPGAAFSGSYILDFGSKPYPVPLTPKAPLGSLIYDPSAAGVISPAGDTYTLTISVGPGQTMTVAVQTDSDLQASVTLLAGASGKNVLATGTASAPGEEVVLQPVATNGQLAGGGTAKTYWIVVAGANGTTGSYSVQMVLNAALEGESHGGASNDTLATAQDLEPSFVDLHRATNANNSGAQPARAAVLGTLEAAPGTYSTIVDSEDFESGSLGPQWTTYSSDARGRIQVTGAYGTDSGSYALLMDRDPSGSNTLNEATWTVDLSGQTQATLQFAHININDENHGLPSDFTGHYSGDGVAISDDGVNWHTILNASFTSGWQTVKIDLAAEAAAAGMTLGADFQIKFQQYDNFPLTTDGRGYDNIVLGIPVPAEDYHSFSLQAGESATLTINGSAGLELQDAAGTTVATAGSGPTNVDQIISNFIAPASGTYYARISSLSDSASDYTLLVTRNADFDTEGNDDIASAQEVLSTQVAGRQWTLGYVFQNDASGIVDEVEPNDSLAEAQDLDTAGWSLADNPYIQDSTSIPHVSVQGTGNGTYDYYSFTVANAGDVGYFDIDLTSGLDSYLNLYDSNGTNLATSDDNGGDPGSFSGLDSRIGYTFGAPGTYIIRVASFPAQPVNSGASYTLQVSVQDHAVATGGPNGDFYQVTLAEGGTLEVATATPGGGSGEFDNQLDPAVRVYDADGNLVASDDNSADDGRNARLTYNVSAGGAGTYYVEVTSSDATPEYTSGEYILTIKGNIAGENLYAAGDAVAGASAAGTLTPAALQSAVTNAIGYWQAAGVDTAPLNAISVRSTDLVGSMLGHAFSNAIIIDSNAAGYGWSFGSGGLTGSIDLESTLIHEMGHELGFEHTGGGVMSASLAPASSLLSDSFGDALSGGVGAASTFNVIPVSVLSGMPQSTTVDDATNAVVWSSPGRSLEPALADAASIKDELLAFSLDDSAVDVPVIVPAVGDLFDAVAVFADFENLLNELLAV